MIRSLGTARPVVNLKPLRTRDYSVEVQRSGPATLPALYHNLHLVAVVLSGEPAIVRDTAGGTATSRLTRGDAYLRSVGPAGPVIWPVGVHALYVHLHPRLIRQLGEEVLGVAGLGLRSQSCLSDPVLSDIALALYESVSAEPHVRQRSHDLVLALAHHVTLKYTGRAAAAPRIGLLSIEEILDVFRGDATAWDGVAALAARCGLSRAHFSRRVRSLAGLSPYHMVLGSRIEAVKHLLQLREATLSEVAYDTGFVDQSHLTRVFQRFTGLTPATYMRGRDGGNTAQKSKTSGLAAN